MRRITHQGTAVRLVHGDTEKPERAHLLPQIGGELVGAVDLGGARGDLGLSEAARRGAQHVDVLAKSEAQSRQLDRRGTAGEVAGSIHSGSSRGKKDFTLRLRKRQSRTSSLPGAGGQPAAPCAHEDLARLALERADLGEHFLDLFALAHFLDLFALALKLLAA